MIQKGLSRDNLCSLGAAINRTFMPNTQLKLDAEISSQEDAERLLTYQRGTKEMQGRIYLPARSPQHLFEWASSIILVGALILPVLMAKPLQSTGQAFLVNAGLHPQHLAIFMGFLGLVRIVVLSVHGRFGGWCPWIRSFTALIGAFIWCEFLVSNALNIHAMPGTPIAIPIYVGLTIGELVACTRAVLDARFSTHIR